MKRNPEGLLWSEWLAAATISKKLSDISPRNYRQMYEDWREGVDPTEWAELISKGLA
jgi:hypothetical protein